MEERATSPTGGNGRESSAAGARAFSPRTTDQTIRDFRPPEHPSQPGRRLVAGYELLEELGQGGMGVVYLARQIHLGRLVALKMIRSPLADREELIRFRTEAEAVARLAHPNIVQIHEIGEHDGTPFFSLEFCAGGPLDRHLAGRPLPSHQAARLITTLAHAVQHAHEHGIIHRDLKPANVLLQRDKETRRQGDKETRLTCLSLSPPLPVSSSPLIPKIADFGLAKRLDHPDGMTRVGAIVGTPPYMAPEQAAGQNELIGPATDVWALGAILYECLAGRAPFQTDSVLQTLEQIRQLEPISLRSLNLAVPRDLETICLKCLRKEPAQRYASAQALADDLERWSAGEPIVARPAGRLERAAMWARRRPAAAALLAVSTLLAGVLLAAVPLHIARLNAKVHEARDEAVHAHLRAECERRLYEGRAALAGTTSQDIQSARVLFATAAADIGDEDARADPQLARLRDEARKLEQQAIERIRRQTTQADERDRARQFLALRDEAFFELYRDTMSGLTASRASHSRKLAQRALELVPDPASLPIDEARRIQRARTEVLFLLAEGTARAGSPEAWREALALLNRTAGGGAAAPRSVCRRRARYLALLGRHEEAARERRRAAQIPPTGALDWFLAGLDHWQAGELPAALGDFNRSLQAEPRQFWPQFFRSLVLYRLGEAAEARAALTLCSHDRPEYPWPYLLSGYLHAEAGNLEAAEVDLDRAESCTLDPAAHYALLANRGVLALKRKQPVPAVAYFQRAALLLPDRYHAHAHLAQAYRQRGEVDRALAALDHAVRLAPDLGELYRLRAELHQEQGRPILALHDLDAALRLSSADRSGAEQALDHRERARILYSGRRFADALAACRATLARSPEDAVAIRLEAERLLELGRPREALEAYNRYLKKRKADVELHRRRARARADLNDLGGVVDEYSAALTLRRDAPLLTARGWAYLVNAAPRPALRDFMAALALAPDSSDALSGRAAARVELGDWRSGSADAEAALRRGPRSSRHLYNVARVLARAATMAPAGRHAGTLSARATAVLRDAVAVLPPGERKRFWIDQVRRDSAFRGLVRIASFADLDRQYSGSAPVRRIGTAP